MITNTLQVYLDLEYVHLRLEFEQLTQELTELKRLRAEIKEKLHILSHRYQQELSQLIVELFQLRRAQLKQDLENLPEPAEEEPEATPEEEEEEKKEKTYAGPDWESDGLAADELPEQNASTLQAEEEQLLKRMFRQACKLCHPDMVPEAEKQVAEAMFIALKEAYARQDLNRVGDILDQLLENRPLAEVPEEINDKEQLRSEIRYLRVRVRAVHREIETLKDSPPYQKLAQIDDMDFYFDDLKAKLRRQINRLKRKKTKTVPV